jgi:serine phosphatase RsbU (regulator of sigma subunit)
VGAYRHARRKRRPLAACCDAVDEVVAEQFGPDRFVTGVLAELDVTRGTLRYIAAGHHPALLLRSGSIVRRLGSTVRLPFGLSGMGLPPAGDDEVGTEDLEPGDRIVLYTDGVTEARASDGTFFGTDRLEDLLVRADASAASTPELTRRLVLAVLDHQADALQDDATILVVDWHPPASSPIMDR